MHNDKESPFNLRLLDNDLSLQVVRFSGREGLNQPYCFDINVIGLAPAIDVECLLGRPVFLETGANSGIHGVVQNVSLESRGINRIAYTLALVPRLQALNQQHQRRIFQQQSVPMILRQLLDEQDWPADSYRFELTTGHYPVRPFCIQYEESSLGLFQRLCEEEGIHYHFEHQRNGHVLVLADDSLRFSPEPLLMPFRTENAQSTELMVSELYQRHVAPSLAARQDVPSPVAFNGDDAAANHAFVASAQTLNRGTDEQRYRDQRSRRHLERLRCRHLQVQGQSNHRALHSGCIMQLAEHPLSHFNDQWLVIEATHEGSQPSILADDPAAMASSYNNRFTAVPWSTVFRPALEQSRPSIPGYQPARVCGVPGQAARMDDRGRIAVTLWPNEPTAPVETPGLWLNIALATLDAPARRPLAGSDVLVSFLDSDPDRPVICAVMPTCEEPRPVPPRERPGDTRLLLDWLVNRAGPAS
ncbi:type VI secretion system Vgr family protein [Pseudomonas vancouverensis]|uniref:Type VI secretion system tip protein VgrG n=1 Tax=Pseudomonas vancouverensis TaxID=95300 RepID=A0A1H2NW87_PSEVA|nr:type VI secretion system tip protein TssI/VgrG [Pseudomonas vancouverensis]KAB0496444.1 type VI secretion system tip protein VgrG [Pseudomonas vancouverensis]TDB64848.1 type VI secretion system tip protein VgrG [Pseudomonas vancouverensis]SDV09702.1 type VI secretion system secreted protein VgrG [Pseudomonas vancouverensis]